MPPIGVMTAPVLMTLVFVTLSGTMSVMTTPVASIPPALEKVRVYVMGSPGAAMDGSTLLTMVASAFGGSYSNAPVSQAIPCGRLTPRWSVDRVQLTTGTWSIAGLPLSNAWVSVSPPLFCNGPRFGFVLCRSPGPFKPSVLQVPSLTMLLPLEVNRAPPHFRQSPPPLLATIVLARVYVPP